MKDFKTILEAYGKLEPGKQKVAVATVVRVRGSSYRSPGARMLITDDGKWVGSISGGCLEGDALRKARQVMLDQKPMTVTYDTREESNQNLGISLGCNGVIDVLIEPVLSAESRSPVQLFNEITQAQTPVALATVFSGGNAAGEKMLLTDSSCDNRISSTDLSNLVRQDLETISSTGQSGTKSYDADGTTYEVFTEYIQPGISLVIFGGGFDARPVSALAKQMGWEVQVTDECAAHIAPIFFPAADKLSLCQRQFIDRDFRITPYTACVLMSHNYEYDRDVLRKLLSTPTPYIGILGPRKRFDKMRAELMTEGIDVDKHAARIHSPIGLDIGAEAPDEISVSIVAEIKSKFSNRAGGFLKHRSGPIHERDVASDQVYKKAYLQNA